MKTILLTIVTALLFVPNVSLAEVKNDETPIDTKKFLTEYRNYPFQWVFPEYFYKAEIIRVEKEKKIPEGYTQVNLFGLSACIPTQYTHEIKRKSDILYFKSKTGDVIMMIKSKDSSMLCTERNQSYMKDYCSAFSTVQEYNHKLFTLTPDTVQSMGDKFIVHDKGGVFETAKKIEIYSADHFMAYVKVIKDDLIKDKKMKFSHEITLFHSNGPLNSHVIISFLAKDDTLLKHFVSTIE